KHIAAAVLVDVAQVLADRVSRALEPIGPLVSLLGGQDFDETAAERVELVTVGDVPVQAHTQELRQHVDAFHAAIDAVADRDVDEAVLPGQRHGRLAAKFRQRIEPRSTAAAQDQTENVLHGKSRRSTYWIEPYVKSVS